MTFGGKYRCLYSRREPRAYDTCVRGEVYYSVLRECGQPKADEIDRIIDTFPVNIIDIDKYLARVAGKYKTSKKMSYADCMDAALAKLHRAN